MNKENNMEHLIASCEANIAGLSAALNAVYTALEVGPSRAQITRLYAIAASHGWNHTGVLDLITINFHKASTTQLTMIEYDAVCDFLEKSLCPNTTTMKTDTNTINFLLEPK